MQITLTPVSKGSYVEIFADIYEKENNRRGSEYALVAEPAKFSYKRTLFTRDEGPILLTLPVKVARQFARTLLALTRQDGDVENEREKEIRELKEKLKEANNHFSELSARYCEVTDGKDGKDAK